MKDSLYAEKLLSPTGISKKARKKWLPIAGESLVYEKWLHLNLNNVFFPLAQNLL